MIMAVFAMLGLLAIPAACWFGIQCIERGSVAAHADRVRSEEASR